MIKHCFEIAPVEQARPRAARTRFGIAMYDPTKVKQFKKAIAAEARLTYHGKPLSGPVMVTAVFYRPIQASISKQQKVLRAAKKVLPTVKPDLDNYVKSFIDALHGIYWVDDNLICKLYAEKYYGAKPRIEIEVSEINE